MTGKYEGSRRVPPTLLASCMIPWDDDNRLLEELFREQVRSYARHLTRHLYIFGTAGEGHAVSDDQFRSIARIFYDEALKNDVTPMLGVISLSLSTIIDRIALGEEMGYRQFQLSFPCWGALSDLERDAFFRETCGRFPASQFLHYNTKHGGHIMTANEYKAIGGEHENLVAIKFSSWDPDETEELVSGSGPLQCFLVEPAYGFVRDRYECGLLLSLSEVSFRFALDYYNARGQRLSELNDLMRPIFDAVVGSVSEKEAHMDGTFQKMFCKLHDRELPLRLLPPYLGATDDDFRRFLDRVAAIVPDYVDS